MLGGGLFFLMSGMVRAVADTAGRKRGTFRGDTWVLQETGTGAESCDVCLWTGASAASDGQPVDGAEMAAGEQIRQTAELLKRAAKGLTGDPVLEQRLWRRLPAELKYLGLRLCGLRVFRSGQDRPEIYLSLQTVRIPGCRSKAFGASLGVLPSEAASGVELSCSDRSCVRKFSFRRGDSLSELCGISKVTKAGELVSGDSYSLLQKDTGTIVMSLADGMGSGLGACQESEKVIGLLEQFLEAGFPQETAVRMIHSCMLLQNTQERYSTIDLCMVDLYEGDCDFLKSGAAPTFLKYGEEIEVLQPGCDAAGNSATAGLCTGRTGRLRQGCDYYDDGGVLEALPGRGS